MPRILRDEGSPARDETLGEYVRRIFPIDPDRLSASERALAMREIAWTKENAHIADWLDGWCGFEVRLTHSRRRHDDTMITAGSSFVVRARFFDRLLCEGLAGVLLLKPDWLEIVDEKRKPAAVAPRSA